jgi:hypothetical protein
MGSLENAGAVFNTQAFFKPALIMQDSQAEIRLAC